MTKKVFLIIFGLAVFILAFLPVKQNWLISPVMAEISIGYTVLDGGSSGYFHPYLQPLNQIAWETVITNNDPIVRNGTLYATVENSKYSSKYSEVSPGNWTVISDTLLSYNYSLPPLDSRTIHWYATLKDNCPNPTNSVYSELRNSAGAVVGSDTGYPLSRVYLTLKNRSGDSIRVYTYANGVLQYDAGTPLANGGDSRIEIWRGGVNGSSLFICSNPFSYSFTVTGVAGASYSCSVGDDSLINNCISEHTATCTKTTSPTPDEPTPTEPTPGDDCSEAAWTCPGGTSHNNWCADPDYCRSVGGTPINDGDYCSGAMCFCCTIPPPVGEKIAVNIVGTNPKVCDQVTIEVYQEPNNHDSSECYYDYINVKLDNPGGTVLPPNLVGCRAENFQDRDASNSCDWEPSGSGGDGRCRTCVWDTSSTHSIPEPDPIKEPDEYDAYEIVIDGPVIPFPSGYYKASVYYGGHDPGSGCDDGQASATDDATLMKDKVNDEGEEVCDYDPFNPSEPCPAGTTPIPVDISLKVDVHFNTLWNWTTVSGKPGVVGGWNNCCYKSRGDNCDAWSDNCSGIVSYSGNFLADVGDGCEPEPYVVSKRLDVPWQGEYLVSAMGTGVKSERDGHGGGDSGKSRPYMKLVSESALTGDLKITDDDCSWQEGTYKIFSDGSWIDVFLKSKTIDYTHNLIPVQSAFDELRLYYCASPKTCFVSTPSEVKNKIEPFQVSFSGDGLGSGETTRLWLEKRDGGEVTGVIQGVDYLSKSCSGGNCYYELAKCTDDDSGSCNGSFDVSPNWPVGEYYFHCDVPHSPGACSGNPLCTYTSSTFCNSCPGPKCGTYDCGSSWEPCSTDDKKCFCISAAPDSPLASPCGFTWERQEIDLVWQAPASWGFSCSGGAKQYSVYITEVGIDESCPAVDSLANSAYLKTAGRFGSANCSALAEESTSCPLANLNWQKKYCWVVVASNGSLTSNSNPCYFIVTNPDSWFQTQGGDVYGQSILSPISEEAASRFFSLSSSWGDSGLVSSSSKEPEPADFNDAQVSQTNADWRAQGNLSTIANRYTYQYFVSLLDINETNEEVNFQSDGGDLINPAQLAGGKDVVAYSGDNMAINNAWDIGNRKIIAFVDGDLRINEPVTVGSSGFLALIVNGNLTIDVGTNPESTSPLLQGVYIVDGAIIIPEREAEPKFVGEGIFFARGGFSLEKDLNDANVSYPAELFIFNPRYLFAAPRVLRYAPQFWQELAP
jgi:hypothetical protein